MSPKRLLKRSKITTFKCIEGSAPSYFSNVVCPVCRMTMLDIPTYYVTHQEELFTLYHY